MTIAAKILQELIATKGSELDAWFNQQYQNHPSCFYSSVDVRDSGYKMAPVDTNLFPAGFNNLSETKQAATQASSYLQRHYPACKKILIIPENHSRNNFYFANVTTIKNILKQAGYNVHIGLVIADLALLQEIQTNAPDLEILPVQKTGDKLSAGDFTPDLILLNTDLTSGVPPQLQELSQPIIPSVNHGWHTRTKSKHFIAYDQVLDEFSQHFGIDKFLFSASHYCCGKIDFKEQKGIECVALAVDKAIYHLQKKYTEYGIPDQPYVYIKAERGTYGMGIMTATSSEDVYAINKKIRNKMDIIKEGVINSEVIIQEGIKTVTTINNNPAEPLIYLINGEPIASFFRFNSSKDTLGNLNSRGAEITNDTSLLQDGLGKISAYNLIAKLASLAAARE